MRQALDKTLRKKLEDTVVKARDIVEQAVFEALQRLGVAETQAPSYLSEEERALRNKLRAHARQLGDKLKDGKQETERLINEMAYEHWHRMLFARYLEQNNLLMYDEYTSVTLDECSELAEEEDNCKDGWELAGRLAQKMLPQIFRVDSPVFDIKLSMNRVEELESLIAQLDSQTYQAQDSLGWCYQFWQTKKKDQVNKSGVKIGAQELSPVTQLFTEPYMVSFLLDNALGAWWANKRLSQDDLIRANNEQELRELAAIPGVPLEYLRFTKEESADSEQKAESWKPAAGGFEKWPENLSELKTLDPCCGSGHFLIAVFLMLVPMRMQLEGLSEKQAVDAVLRDNIHGLELDQRCVELAAFALALESWRYPNAGGYRTLPELQLACSGMSIDEAQKEWKDLAPKYILMVYRHYQNTQDLSVVKECWQAVTESIEFLSNLVAEGDDLPLTRGTDDTFDNLASHGISIYCASLWVAGLQAASELAQLMGESERAIGYLTRSKKALATVEQSLWDDKEGYYHFFVTPVQAKHLTGEGYQALEILGLTLTGDAIADKNTLNAYLNETDTSINISKVSQRVSKKRLLSETAPQAFTQEYLDLVPDSDNSFGDALLADSYLKLIGLDGIFPQQNIQRALDYVYKHNFEINSPKLGVANMTLADGSPHEAFQAQDVWIGVQFSVATALSLAGKSQQAETLMDTVYTALYDYSKIPFAAPEGFNCSVSVNEKDLIEAFKVSQNDAKNWLSALKYQNCVLSDGRINPALTKDTNNFVKMMDGEIPLEKLAGLHKWLLSTGLKYTAGRYFRPGMIFAYLY